MSRRALITGIGGQDGTLLAERLLEQGYQVVGVVHRPAVRSPYLEALAARVTLETLDLAAARDLTGLLDSARPDEVYHLASPSHVPASWGDPAAALDVAGRAAAMLLAAVQSVAPAARVFLASSAEVFGEPAERPQTETTPIAPITPYGAAKAYALLVGRAYRRQFGTFVSSGILYNHESPRRPLAFVPRKVARAAALIASGQEAQLRLGNLEARRDWSYAGDVVEGMWLALQADGPDDYVFATGEDHSVGELVEAAFEHVGLDWRRHVRRDPALERGAADATVLVGDSSKARRELGWRPAVDFRALVAMLVDAELARVQAPDAPSR